MGKTDAQVTQYGGVGEVALPAGDRQLAGQVLEQCVGDAQVAFGVFEVDRVDLVRHGRRTDFASDGALLEVAQGDVAPDIAIEVDQDGVEARNGVEQLGDVVVRLDLRGVRVEGQAQFVFDEGAGVFFPVDLRVGRQVGVIVAHGAVDLAQQRYGRHLSDLALQAVHHVGQLFAQGGRRSRLAVGARQHRHFGKAQGQLADGVGGLAHQRQHYVITAFAQHQGVGQVVDVLAGAGKVNELADLGQFRQLGGLFLEQVLNGFYVMVGGALDLFDTLGVLQSKVVGQGVEHGVGFGGKSGHFTDGRVSGQALQPAHFNQNAGTDQAVLAENRAQGLGFAGVAAVNRGNRSERRELHGVFSDSRATKLGAYHT
ncbi:MAG: hypothetical protein GAK37_03259 [Pseudomonas sp.]|nr:MAG: hypothetical protein GAK37_03259 [Pseudomonas sp.]